MWTGVIKEFSESGIWASALETASFLETGAGSEDEEDTSSALAPEALAAPPAALASFCGGWDARARLAGTLREGGGVRFILPRGPTGGVLLVAKVRSVVLGSRSDHRAPESILRAVLG